ncbi:MAG: methyltransferase domain-containing protein [bacterium]
MRNVDYYRNLKGEIWLNIASSTYVLEEFVNLDNTIFLYLLKYFKLIKRIVPRKYSEIIEQYCEAMKKVLLIKHDCRTTLFFPDNSVDHILCSHFLEHVFPIEMERIIRDFYRVMKTGATLHVIVPDLKEQAERYLLKNRDAESRAADDFIRATLLSNESRGSLKYRLLEFFGGFGLQHRLMYDSYSMTKKLRDVGFNILDKNETPSKLYRLNDSSVHVVACKQ